MNELADLVSRIIRAGTLADPSGSLPPEPPVQEDQAKFKNLLNQGQGPFDQPGPEQIQPAGPGSTASIGPDLQVRPAGLSGDGILSSLARMSGPIPAGPQPVGTLDSPESLIAFQGSLVRGTTALDLVGEVQSRAKEGIDQLTR